MMPELHSSTVCIELTLASYLSLQKKLREYDSFLKGFRFKEALQAAVKTKRADVRSTFEMHIFLLCTSFFAMLNFFMLK